MSKIIALALCLAAPGLVAVAASANDHGQEEARRLVVQGRQTVWVQPSTKDAERPYALTGDTRNERTESAQPALRPQGRAGYRR